MKQHITVEQLEQLTDEKVCNLNTLMKHEWALTNEELQKYSWQRVLEDTAKFCTIGKMIEVLENEYQITLDGNYDDGNWSVVLYHKRSITPSLDFHSHKKSLCDALWEVVKEVLN